MAQQPIKSMKKMAQQPIKSMKKNLLTPKRTMEVADSLMKMSEAKKENAYIQRSIGNATVKNKVANKQLSVSVDFKTLGNTLSGNDRLKIAERKFKEATQDSLNSERYKKLALKAMNKNK
jgi:hypothetical protein